MISKTDDRLEVSGAMTLPGATALLAEGNACIGENGAVFDLAAVTTVDSSGIAVIFGWLREAQRRGKTVRISHPPKDLLSLAEVYGVVELLPLV